MSASENTPQRTNAVSLGDEEAVKKVLLDSVLGLWDVVNNLTRLQPTKRDRYRVTIFGSARAKPEQLPMTRPSEQPRRLLRWAATLLLEVVRV
jgi:hypothetical protein